MPDTFIGHEPCPDCGSRNNVGVWKTQEGREKRYCFSCQKIVGATAHKKVSWPLCRFYHSPIEFRRLTKETCIKYNVVRAGSIIAFPLYWNNKVRGVKFRDFLFNKQEKRFHMSINGLYNDHFFGWNAVNTKKIVAIALGEFDALATFQATGIPCISPTNGDGSLVKCIKNDYERLAQFGKIVLLPDMDKNNNSSLQPSQAVTEAVEVLGEDRCFVANLSFDDPNEYLMQSKAGLLKQAFWSAEPSTQKLFYQSTSDLITPTQMGIITGLEALDQKLQGLRAEEVTYVLGAPGQGKTTFVQYIMWSLANRGVRMCSVVLEGGHRKFATRLANMFAGGNFHLLSIDEANVIKSHIDKHILTARVGSGAASKEIEKSIRAAAKVHNAQVIIVDNITAAGNTDKFFESTSEFVYMFDRLASELGVHFVVISHVGREGYNEPPKLGSGLGSGMIERVAFNVVGVHRKKGEPVSRIEILKNREIGMPGEGVFNLKYNLKTCRFEELNYAYEYRGTTNS